MTKAFDPLKMSLDEISPPPPIQYPSYPYPRPRHPEALVLKIYQTLDDIHAAGLGKWASPCGGPFELLVQFKSNGVLFYKLRCQACGRSNGHIAHDSIPPDVRVRVGPEIPEPRAANEEWYDRRYSAYHPLPDWPAKP
jgi:hypothetical protein